MDEFMIRDVMNPGFFGIALLVRERKSGLELTLKKVECLDEGHANQALKEALSLLNLKHRNIVKYRKLFITWDQTISSVFLSMVMDCPYRITLETIITTRRDKKRKISKQFIKTFLGQMVDALAHLHEQKIAHRNIKPSNIQLSSKSQFLLFDFEPATITRDRVKIRKRVKKNMKHWLSPESLSLNQWTEKSDIWCLGCVVLDMVTCHVIGADLRESQLLSLWENQVPLNVITHSGLRQVLSMMFQLNPAKRANVWELVNENLVKSCLEMCGVSLNNIRRTLPSGVHGPPFHQGFDSVLEFMETYRDVESVQISVLSFLLSDQNNVFYRIRDVVQAISMAMQRHLFSAGVQLAACQVLLSRMTAVQGQSGDISGLCSRELVSELHTAIQNHPEHTQLLSQAFLLFSCLASQDQTVREVKVCLEMISEVVKATQRFPGERDVITSCCKCLWSLMGLEPCLDNVALTGAVKGLSVASEIHMKDCAVMECVCAALCFLTQQGVSNDKDVEDCVLLLMHTLIGHPPHTHMVKYALLALTNLLNSSELAAIRLLLAPDGGRGLDLIKEVKLHHHNNPEVIGSVCGLLSAMAQYGNVFPEMVSENIPEELEMITQKFVDNKEVSLLASQALSRLRDSGLAMETDSA